MSNCVICFSSRNVENAHPYERGMGGRGKKAPAAELLTFPMCAGTGGNTSPESCHGAHHAGFLDLDVTKDNRLRYRSTRALEADNAQARQARKALDSRGLFLDGLWHVALYEQTDPDTVDVPRETIERIR